MLREVVNKFEGFSLRSISVQKVGLEHIYIEVTRVWFLVEWNAVVEGFFQYFS